MLRCLQYEHFWIMTSVWQSNRRAPEGMWRNAKGHTRGCQGNYPLWREARENTTHSNWYPCRPSIYTMVANLSTLSKMTSSNALHCSIRRSAKHNMWNGDLHYWYVLTFVSEYQKWQRVYIRTVQSLKCTLACLSFVCVNALNNVQRGYLHFNVCPSTPHTIYSMQLYSRLSHMPFMHRVKNKNRPLNDL